VVCLQVMRIVEAMEGKGFRLPLTKGEAELAEKLAATTRQVDVSCPLLSYSCILLLSGCYQEMILTSRHVFS
jgi:hypothetical protein